MATSFSGGGSRSTRREPPTMGKQLVNFITCGCESSAPFFVIYKVRGEPTPYWLVWVVRSNDLTHWATRAPLFIEVDVSSQEIERSCTFEIEVLIVSLFLRFFDQILKFFPTVWYFFKIFFILFCHNKVLPNNNTIQHYTRCRDLILYVQHFTLM